MKTIERLQKLIEKKAKIEDRLYKEKLRQHERINSFGWGYGMRCSKINFSTTKEDRLKEQLKKIENEINSIKG